MRAQRPAFLCHSIVAREDSPSFAALNDLGAVEAERCRVAECAQRALGKAGAVGRACVSDQT